MAGSNVLLIEDEPADAALVSRSFRGREDEVGLEHVTTLQAGIERLAAGDVDAVVLDLKLPDSQGIETVARIRESDPAVPIVVCTGAAEEETAVAALAAGAQDYLVKGDLACAPLLRSIRCAIERSRIAREELIVERRRQRVEKIESLGALYAGIGWAFNTLIGTIFDRCDHALASLGRSGYEVRVRTALLEIHRAAFREAEMVQRLRDYAAVERSACGQVDLAAFTLEAADFLTALVSPKIDVTWETDGGPLIVDVARHELHRLLVSLIANAAEAIGDGPGSIAISTGALEADAALLADTHGWSDPRPGSYAFLRVADTGRGLEAAAQERIFDPFFTTKLAGRGLGLTGVAGVLRRRRAVIYVAGTHPAGTVFTILFPRAG